MDVSDEPRTATSPHVTPGVHVPPPPRRANAPPVVAPPRPLTRLDVEAIRAAGERTYAKVVEQHPLFARVAMHCLPQEPDAKDIRRALMAKSLRLTESMAADAYRIARDAQRVLGVQGALELYQRSGPENAAMHLVREPILLEIQGSLLSRLDEGSMRGLFGHELGHYLAHGPTSPFRRARAVVSALGALGDPSFDFALSRLSMMSEITADRFGLLACQDLGSMLRLEMAVVTGLAGPELTWDTDAYLAQAREQIDELLTSGIELGAETHPDHNVRAYALWLFSETKLYRELTGRGPGTRDLAEVDATTARILAARGEETPLALDHSRLGEPPRDLLECALSCAVLVAFADGELSDEERETIEHQFADVITDWLEYLDPEVAGARLVETACVLARAGDDLVRGLFFALVHVMLADGQPHPNEVAMIIAIGRALGAEKAFRRHLAIVLDKLGAAFDLEDVVPSALPLPARPKEVEDAFQTFLQGVTRRGETTITLRRLLRLLGSEQRSEELVARIQRAFTAERIEASPPPTQADLDERMVLVSTKAKVVEQPVAPVTGSRAALIAALKRLREQLVSGDGRSPSVRLRQIRRGRAFDLMELERVSIGMGERVLQQVLARRSVRAVDAADAGRHGPAASVATELLALARENAQRVEETGAHDLYVGYPFLTGSIRGYGVRAPLVLYPVDLERDGDGARGFRIVPRRDELPVANQSLLRLIFNKREFDFSDELSDELEALAGAPDGGPEAVRKKLEEVGLATTPGGGVLQRFRDREDDFSDDDTLAIEDVAVLGLFPQSSSDLLQDYDGLLQELADPRADAAALLAAASTLLPESLTSPAAHAGAAEPSLADWAPVIPADPSQRSVIAETRKHGATVVDGPPGTGKSQVIVNLVAEALRRGERVAVVCEKRAALDVVHQRLTAIGFGKALAVVHDVHEDRKALYRHIAARVEARERIPFDPAEAERVRVEHDKVCRMLAQRAAALRETVPGLEMTLAELIAFVASQPRSKLPATFGLEQIPQTVLRDLLDVVVALHPFADLWGRDSWWRNVSSGHVRPLLRNVTPSSLQEIERALERAVEAARNYEALVASCPVPVQRVDAARAALGVAVATRRARSDERDRALFGTIAAIAATEPERLREASEAKRAWQESSTALVKLEHPVSLEARPELIAALSVLQRWASVWYRIFVLGWWKARGVLRRELARIWPERAGEAISPTLLDDLADRIAASRAWKVIGEVFTRLGLAHVMPRSAAGLADSIDRVTALGDALRDLGAVRAELEAVQAWLPESASTSEDLARWDAMVDARLALLAARDALATAVAPLAAHFPWLDAYPRAEVLADLLARWKKDATRLAESDALIARAATLLVPTTVEHALALLDAIRSVWRGAPATTWRTGVTAAWAAAHLARLEREKPGLAQLGLGADDREVERLAERLRELETDRRELEIERTLAQIDNTPLLNVQPAAKGARRTPEQKLREELLKEARKQRSLMPLRTFVRRFAPQGLLDVLPVWLLSPETMAILFPRQALFDLVVFDEASQCTVEAGLPVLLRAKRVVIAGDEKQMPPSSYFTLGSDDDEEPGKPDPTGAEASEAAADARALVRDLLGAESLLSLARPRVNHAGLTWHYRCRDESLIAFSNHAMYHGGLLTIPSTAGAAAPSALHWVEVPDGVYNAGENLREAERVVDVIDELLARSPRPTIGVVTFNLKQRRAVLDAIDARCSSDPAFRERWTEASSVSALDERPFVKNLEQVQGDERDVIVFSLGHAPVERKRGGVPTGETYVPARFGPLGQRGGERRLNVAISRAKGECYVVASFHPSQLTVASSKHQGPRLFKHFLEFAHHLHHGRRVEAARVLDLVRASGLSETHHRTRMPIDGFVPVATQVALALEAAGIPYEPDVGASGFRVPIAILDPSDPTRYALAILIDDGRGSADPFELHVHRPGVLRQRGWNVLSIHAATWLRRRDEVLAEIEALVPGCRGAVHGEVYTRHREQRLRPAKPTGVTTPTVARPVQPAAVAPIAPVVPDSGPTVSEPNASGSMPVAPAEEIPAWALAITDGLFRKAVLHIEAHGALDEAELTSLVGGPRRARAFARELDVWRANLPFQIEIAQVNGVKIYRRKEQG